MRYYRKLDHLYSQSWKSAWRMFANSGIGIKRQLSYLTDK